MGGGKSRSIEFDSLLLVAQRSALSPSTATVTQNQGHSNTETLVALEQANQSFAVFADRPTSSAGLIVSADYEMLS